MNSIRVKTTLLTVCAIVVSMAIVASMGVAAIRSIGQTSSEEMLLLLCETGERNLDYYFESVEQSVEMVSAYVEADLADTDPAGLADHLDRVGWIFERMARKTSGVLTYYYRIDPHYSADVKGFWYVNLDGEGFREHEVTDITLYDQEDTSHLVWFTVPKHTGTAIWLPPYITDNLDTRVISYNVPIYRGKDFVGVVGIELDYSMMADQVDHITLYQNGYAFLNDEAGRIVYHPKMDVTAMAVQPQIPEGLLHSSSTVRYTYEGVEKLAVWLPLSNGMRLNVSVPVSEISAGWQTWVNQIFLTSFLVLAVFILITLRFTDRITKPLRDLTQVAEQLNQGNYDCELDYQGTDEVGILTNAFRRLISHLRVHIRDLSNLAYADALTSLRNKGAFDLYLQKLQNQTAQAPEHIHFAVCIFDCDDLKQVNDHHGHDKGDIYLKRASSTICHVFSHSPVFRIGGDEFAAILQNTDFENREALMDLLDQRCAETNAQDKGPWERVDISRGMAVYDPQEDETVSEVVRRADKLMYENKWVRKHGRRG